MLNYVDTLQMSQIVLTTAYSTFPSLTPPLGGKSPCLVYEHQHGIFSSIELNSQKRYSTAFSPPPSLLPTSRAYTVTDNLRTGGNLQIRYEPYLFVR